MELQLPFRFFEYKLNENFQVRHILFKVSISLFNLQGAIFAFLCRESLFIISCRFHLVKNFFNFFRSFFNLSNRFHVLFKTFSTCLPSSQTAYLVYHAKRGLSTTFFVCFQTFRFAPSFSRSDLISIRQRTRFVNTFLLFFADLFLSVWMLDFYEHLNIAAPHHSRAP